MQSPAYRVLALAVLLTVASCGLEDLERLSTTGKFAPPPGRTLLVIGQDLGSVAGYVESVGIVPGGVTTYTDISEGRHDELLFGLESVVDYGAGLVSARKAVETYPNSALVIGLHLVDYSGSNLLHLVDGTHDAAIDKLGEFIRGAVRPVFLRIGYEFDGAWNHYEPEQYVRAFRYITDRLRHGDVDNVATVWQSATSVWGTYRDLPIEAWYPGDEYVDWLGASYFLPDDEVFKVFLEFARERSKPVMVAEATPQGFDLEELTFSGATHGLSFEQRTADEIWRQWYVPFFRFVRDNADVIRAVAYINCDWNEQEMWRPGGANGYWGDSRVEANDEIRDRWMDEVGDEFWLHGSSTLNRQLGISG